MFVWDLNFSFFFFFTLFAAISLEKHDFHSNIKRLLYYPKTLFYELVLAYILHFTYYYSDTCAYTYFAGEISVTVF